MRKLTRILVRRFWGACAFLLISLAVFVAVGRELSPKLDRYKDDLASYIGDQLGVDIVIESLAFDWTGLSPELSLGGVSLLNTDGQVVMAMNTALLKLNLMRSIFNRNVALDKIIASEVNLNFSQNANGVWNFTGLPWTTTANDNFNIDDPLDIFLLIGEVDFSEVQFDLSFRSGETSRLNFRRLNFENSRDFHRLNSSIEVGDRREAVALVLEFKGDPRDLADFSAKGYANLLGVDVEKVVAALPGAWQTDEPLWRNRSMTAEVWFDIFAGGEFLYRGRMDISKSNSSNDDDARIKVPRAIGANFTGRMTSSGFWSVSVRDAVLDWKNFQAPVFDFEVSSLGQDVQQLADNSEGDIESNPIIFSSESIDLLPWMQTLYSTGLFDARTTQDLQTLDPRGKFSKVKIAVAVPEASNDNLNDENNQAFTIVDLRAEFENFSMESWKGTPAVSKLKGYTTLSINNRGLVAGSVDIDTQESAAIQIPTLYDQAMTFDSILGSVNWQVDSRQKEINIHSGLLQVDSEDGNASGYLDLYIPWQKEPGHEQLILQIGLQDSLVKHYEKYLPSRMSQELWDWLNASLYSNDGSTVKGEVAAGGFIYRGGMTPQGFESSSVQLFLDVEDSNIHYHPDWPALTKASGSLWVDQTGVRAQIREGKIFDSAVNSLAIDIEHDVDSGERVLHMSGELSGDANDGLALLQSEVFKPVIKNALNDWSVSGDMRTKLELLIPLETNSVSPKQDIAVTFDDVQIKMEKINAQFDRVNGTLNFDDRLGLNGSGLEAEFLQSPIEVSIANDQRDQSLHIAAKGLNKVSRLREWAKLDDVLQFVEGESQFAVDIEIPGGNNADPPSIDIRSTLVGTTIDLPKPWGKSSTEEVDFLVNGSFGEINSYYRINYNNELFGVFHLDSQGLQRAVLATENDPLLPERDLVLFQGELEFLDYDAWKSTFDNYFAGSGRNSSSSSSSLPLVFNLTASQFTFGNNVIEKMAVAAEVVDEIANINFHSEQIGGKLNIYGDPSKPIDVILEHVRLPKQEKRPPTWADIFYPPTRSEDALEKLDPSTIPAMDFFAREVYYGDGFLGSWSFQLRPNLQGLAISDLRGVFEHGQLVGKLEGDGAALQWAKTENGTETWVQGKLRSSNLESVMEQLELPALLQSDDATFDFTLRWPGAPTSMANSVLDGEISFLLEHGSFYRSEGDTSGNATLQLISILNFDTWIRRLRLDFSDLGRGGTPFDRASGVLEFTDGLVFLNQPLSVETQSGEFELTGVLDLEHNELDTRLTATLPMGGNLTFLTALAAGLPAAVGVWVVSKIFDEQIDKVSTLSYKLNGDLSNPKVEFDSMGESKTASQ